MKNYTEMMISSLLKDPGIINVKYFQDLIITAAFHKKFLCDIRGIKSTIPCKKNLYSLELILKGEVYLRLDDQVLIHLKAPAVFWIGDETKEFAFKPLPGIGYEHLWIDFTGERGKRIYESLRSSYPRSSFQPESLENILPVFEYFAEKFKLARRPTSSPEDVILLELLFYELMRSDRKHPKDLLKNDPYHILALGEKIRNSPFDKYNPEELAKEANLSCVHFRAVFKKILGLPVKQYILKYRMMLAGELLKNGQFRIGEMADYCDFPCLSSFSRAFRKYYGISPKRFLKENT